MKYILIATLIILSSCSPKQNQSKIEKETNVNIANLIEFEDIKSELSSDGSGILKSSSGSILPVTLLPLDIEEDDQGVQVIRLINQERRSSINMNIEESSTTLGISVENNCEAILKRRQSCYLTINIDASQIGVGTLASHDVTINNETYTFQYNVIASTKLTPEEEAEGLLESSPDNTSNIDFGTLEITNEDSIVKTIQIRNKSRKSLPLIIDDSNLSSVTYTGSCLSSLDRGKACVLFLKLDSVGKGASSLSESITVAGKVYNLQAELNELTTLEVEQQEQAIADNAISINPETSIDLGQIKQGRTKINSIRIQNLSREDVVLNIDNSGLSEFSLGTCPNYLSRRKSCYLNVIYDASSSSLGAKSETIMIGSTSYNLNVEVISNGEVINPPVCEGTLIGDTCAELSRTKSDDGTQFYHWENTYYNKEKMRNSGMTYYYSYTTYSFDPQDNSSRSRIFLYDQLPQDQISCESVNGSWLGGFEGCSLGAESCVNAGFFWRVYGENILDPNDSSGNCGNQFHGGNYQNAELLLSYDIYVDQLIVDLCQGTKVDDSQLYECNLSEPVAPVLCNGYDKTNGTYYNQFPEVGDFIESLACAPFTINQSFGFGILFTQPYDISNMFYPGENIHQVDSVYYNGSNGQCGVGGRSSDNFGRQYFQKNYISEEACEGILRDMEIQLSNNPVSNTTSENCVEFNKSTDQWSAYFYDDTNGNQSNGGTCTDLINVTMDVAPCSNNTSQTSCENDSLNNCSWDSSNSYCETIPEFVDCSDPALDPFLDGGIACMDAGCYSDGFMCQADCMSQMDENSCNANACYWDGFMCM